ncbi:MAG: hypothetical protein QOG84_1916 [Sphingomonadales bacterium]|jgi:hypothetical protein|nr:hypothetical protein [Sphingomonadales bacterium]
MAAIAASFAVAALLWFAVRRYGPVPAGMEALGARMVFALKCVCVAILFCLVAGVEAVAHERLQSPAFDPLAGHRTRRLDVNLRYLQNTLEQSVVFAAALFGLAVYSPGEAIRAVEATTVVWILSRYAFWLGYHRGAALRALGAPGMALTLLVLVYVAARFGGEMAGPAGAAAAVGAFLLLEAILFRATHSPREG